MQENSDLLDITSAAKLLGVSKLTLRNWDNSGALKAVRIGKRGDRRYRREDLNKFSSIKTDEGPPSQEIDKEFFRKYADNNEFWIEEVTGVPCTLEAGMQQISGIGRYFRPALKFAIFYYEQNYLKQALSISESIENTRAQFSVLKNNPKKNEEFVTKFKQSVLKARKDFGRLDFVDFGDLSNKELINEFLEFDRKLRECWNKSA